MITFSLNKREEERENSVLLQATFSQFSKSCFVMILAISSLVKGNIFLALGVLNYAFRQEHWILAQHGLIKMWMGSAGCFSAIATYPLKDSLNFVPFCLPRLPRAGKTLLWVNSSTISFSLKSFCWSWVPVPWNSRDKWGHLMDTESLRQTFWNINLLDLSEGVRRHCRDLTFAISEYLCSMKKDWLSYLAKS